VRSSNSTVSLSNFEESRFNMQLFYADYMSVGLIQMQYDTKGEVHFNQ